ncbi:hypothetical protein JYB87_12605 [Shewanella avicenniae]|uniref:Uncharacterized protein n=1 Tax=Shewanella avicenniae TaxID=2814294 RepID=A0ABX7QNZ5_9GAMM|nr:hypothetical protein [Shewanella avicenniae]QSX32593.1 hypothetical protein JYB87_12605 [Shewanella avicenniae]
MSKPLQVPNELIQMDAETLHSDVTNFIFVSTHALHAELQQIRNLLPDVLVPEVRPDTSTSSVLALAECVGSVLPFAATPTDDELQYALSLLPQKQIALFHARLRKLEHQWIGLVEDHHCQLFAVPPVWHMRWSMLVAGQLYPAYIGGVFF